MKMSITCANCKEVSTIDVTALEADVAKEYGALCDDCQSVSNSVNATLDAYDRYERDVR